MKNKKIVKKYLNKYFASNYLEEHDLEFKSLLRILNKAEKKPKTNAIEMAKKLMKSAIAGDPHVVECEKLGNQECDQVMLDIYIQSKLLISALEGN